MITHLKPDILECQVKWALESITTNKASGSDGIPVKLLLPEIWCCESAAPNMSENLENSAMAMGLEKVSFHSNPKGNVKEYAKSWLIWKDPDIGKDWGQEETGTIEDEMVGWHHWLDGHESEWTPGVGDRQGGLVCCGSWGRRVGPNWVTKLNWTENHKGIFAMLMRWLFYFNKNNC